MKSTMGTPPMPASDWKPSSAAVDPQRYPDIADLMARLHFSPADGRIWLDDQRMQLIHTSAMGVMRRELIEGLGIERARGLLTRMGYNSGGHDAELARRLRPHAGLSDTFAVGPQLHALEGIVRVDPPVRLEIDVERGHYLGEFIWRDSSEDEEHIRNYGIGAEPVCWMQIGYACGYTSVFMGRPILFREVECRATGHSHCRIVGKPAEEWKDAEDDIRFLRAEPFSRGLIATTRKPAEKSAQEHLASMFEDGAIVGVSTGFNAVCHMVRRVADTSATVLFLGESGVGKEVFARTLHRNSPRANHPFVAINCAAIPENLVESELFGVEKGAFTGATVSREGRFERAHGGTLFLDEIGILGLAAQGKLLRAIQEGEIERVGDTKVRRVDVRLVAATNLDLRAEVKAGRFREDLYFRLNVVPVKVPPLRERRDDIPILMNHFLAKYRHRHKRDVTGFTARAIDALLNYELPGNIRELENMIERGVILAPSQGAIDVSHLFIGGENLDSVSFGLSGDGRVGSGGRLDADDRAAAGTDPADVIRSIAARCEKMLSDDTDADAVSLDEIETSLEKALLQSAIKRANGNLSAAARSLGLTRSRLVYRLNNRGMAPLPE
ncbi:regulatory Fis family protein [Panacagrimonas perspica]|uniref:Regulatory Fis family protein n=1 Tax=Panacagrimonas perspica TaxID=381431 RepID=A0A4R7PFP4_9GAMM|nr:sigma-54-dependent Fis family transcriptional regulator [Panacagrimonas perspica]TDU32602.1 regulatory Fis family protein [Panacagrimonas perspica]